MKSHPKKDKLRNEELWNQFRAGDIDALEMIYRNCFKDLYQYGMTIFPNVDLVKDAIQELFVSLVQRENSLTSVKNVNAYLLKALRNRVYDELAKNRKEEISNEAFKCDQAIYLNGETILITNEEMQSRKNDKLVSVINHLPDRQREIVMLIFFEGRTYEEVSNLMSLTVNSAYKLSWKAVNSLKKALSKGG